MPKSLANGLSILFIFSQNQLLDLLIFAMVFGIGMGNTCKSMADSCQCMTKTTTVL